MGTGTTAVEPAVGNPLGALFGTMAANAVTNAVRNLWSHSVIMCGHFPNGVETLERTSITGETRGEWNPRQMLGSAGTTSMTQQPGEPAKHHNRRTGGTAKHHADGRTHGRQAALPR